MNSWYRPADRRSTRAGTQPVIVIDRLLGEPPNTTGTDRQRFLDRAIRFEIRLLTDCHPLRSNFEPPRFQYPRKISPPRAPLLRKLKLAHQIISSIVFFPAAQILSALAPIPSRAGLPFFAITNLRWLRGPTWR